MAKTEVCSCRVHPETKMRLEARARGQGITVGELLNRLAQRFLEEEQQHNDDAAEQTRLHAVAAQFAGIFSGGDPSASESVRDVVRKRIVNKNAH